METLIRHATSGSSESSTFTMTTVSALRINAAILLFAMNAESGRNKEDDQSAYNTT